MATNALIRSASESIFNTRSSSLCTAFISHLNTSHLAVIRDLNFTSCPLLVRVESPNGTAQPDTAEGDIGWKRRSSIRLLQPLTAQR